MRDQEAGGGALLALRLVCWVRFSGRGVEGQGDGFDCGVPECAPRGVAFTFLTGFSSFPSALLWL